MSKIFFCSDHHFDDSKILTYNDGKGNFVRNFRTVAEMSETIVYNHNQVVKKSDLVYFLGDCAIELSGLDYVKRMNGTKILVKGNHDILHINHYLKLFDDILAYKVFPNDFVCSHIPLSKNSIRESFGHTNVHGHTHNRVLGNGYINVCMEQNEYTPVSYDQILKIKKSQIK